MAAEVLYSFGLVLVRHPVTGKFATVIESDDQGLWISGGHVDPGETFETAAVREAKEELGLDIRLTGVIRVEHSPRLCKHPKTGKLYSESRMRVIFTGEPLDLDQPLKSVPDHESDGALWLSREELEQLAKEDKLRGLDFLEFVRYVDDGQPIFPLQVFARESDRLADFGKAGAKAGKR